jgi:hypothetical protein
MILSILIMLSCINVHMTGKLKHDVDIKIKHVYDTGNRDTGEYEGNE